MFPDEPPPAYNDLFPNGFHQINSSQEIAALETANLPSVTAHSSNENAANIITRDGQLDSTGLLANQPIIGHNPKPFEPSQLQPELVRSESNSSDSILSTAPTMIGNQTLHPVGDILNPQENETVDYNVSSEQNEHIHDRSHRTLTEQTNSNSLSRDRLCEPEVQN